MNKNLEIVIPYYRTYDGLKLLIDSINFFTNEKITINVLSFEEPDFDLSLIDKYKFPINFINTKIPNQEKRMYSYAANTSYDFSIYVHTDIEIIEHDPIKEILVASKIDDNIGIIGSLHPGNFIASYDEYIMPWISSHFCIINNNVMKSYFKKIILENNEFTSQVGFTANNQDVFPSKAFLLSSLDRVQSIELPRSISSKLVHYNSATRRKIHDVGHLQNKDSMRNSQINFISGIHALKLKNKRSRDFKNIIILGLGEDAEDAFEVCKTYYINSNIYFCERLIPLKNQTFLNRPIITFNDAVYLEGKSFFYVTTPDYKWFTNKLILAGLAYGNDFRVRLLKGHDYIENDFNTFFGGINNGLHIQNNGKVNLPNNTFLDSPDAGYLSSYNLYKYSVSLFFQILKKPIDWIYLKHRLVIGIKNKFKRNKT